MNSRKRMDEGFTLIELLVVIIIIGILAAIASSVFLNQREKGFDAQAKSDLRNVAGLEETYLTDNSTYMACVAGTGPTSCAALINFQASPNATTNVGNDAANGYCAVSKSSSGNYFVYDSQAGGLVAAPASSFAAIVWPASGTCAKSAARPATF